MPPRPDVKNFWMLDRVFRLRRTWDGLKAGTKVRVNMVSRLGDVGVTPNLYDEVSFVTRVKPELLEET